MDIYVTLCCDRHIDEVVEVFTTPEKAIACADRFVENNARFPEDIEVHDVQGGLYFVTYSWVGDFVRVEKKTLDPEIPEGRS